MLRFVTIPDPNMAMGTVVRLMMTRPAFDKLPFGPWARLLDMQFQRNHCGFVVDADHQVRGFLGWAKTTREAAEAWTHGEPLTSEQVDSGDCLIINAWVETGPEAHRFLFAQFRALSKGHAYVYACRSYPNGRQRFVRVRVADLDTAIPVYGPNQTTLSPAQEGEAA